MGTGGHNESISDAGPNHDYLTANTTSEALLLENTLTKVSGDEKDANYEWKIVIPTDLLPSTKEDYKLLDTEHMKDYYITLRVEDVNEHLQYYYLYPWEIDEKFEVINDNFEHELPKATFSIDKTTVDVTDESQDVKVTIDWTDESGVNLEYFLDNLDEDRDTLISIDGESQYFYTYIREDWNKTDFESTNRHEIHPKSYTVNQDLTTNDRAVVELDYTIPQGHAPGTMLKTLVIFMI